MKKLAIVFVASLLIFAGCKKNLEVMEPTPSPAQVTEMANMQVNPEFDWKTVKTVQVSILSNANAVLYIKASDGSAYYKALIPSGKIYYVEITIPSHAKDVTLELAGQHATVPVENGKINYMFD
ncbi:MAG: hypothetical protein ISR57_05495 [Bacteroidales bacterium]|nr:hypothetical protein [Bacteroidota bacterium]MBL6950085.1 hypothetical protein [Bacteroidales bacterium]